MGVTQVKSVNDRIVPHPIMSITDPKKGQIVSIDKKKTIIELLHKQASWEGDIDWSDQKFGRLWNYHLQYCDFLLQDDLTTQNKSRLTESLYQDLFNGKLDPEPYPASLRSMNVIRCLSQDGQYLNSGSEAFSNDRNEQISNDRREPNSNVRNDTIFKVGSEPVLKGLSAELHFIRKNPETHLMGNHLLENAFALLMGSQFLKHEHFRKKADAIFESELSEQFLVDGAHYERSVMYHQIILSRILEALSYLPESDPWVEPFRKLAQKMLAWLLNMRFQNGDLANFNDATAACNQDTDRLIRIAHQLNLTPEPGLELSESGFRKRVFGSYEWIMKTGGVAPACQPGHTHADTFSFILHVQNKPVIVDRGISTYSPGAERDIERASVSHNCVTSDSLNTTDVWGAFRAGRRPEVHLVADNPAELDMKLLYKPLLKKRFSHRRTVQFEENRITVTEKTDPGRMATGFLHFHPDIKMVNIKLKNEESGMFELMIEKETIRIEFQNILKMDPFDYDFCEDFNKKVVAQGVRYSFRESCSFKIQTE